MNFNKEIKGDNFVLKVADVSYALQLSELVKNNQKELKYIDFTQSLITEEKAKSAILSMQDRWKNKEQYCFFIFSDNCLKGYVAIKVRYGDVVAELSYYLDKASCGKGYITRAIMLLEKIFYEQKGHRLEIFCNAENSKSIAVAKRLGFCLDGTLREYELRDNKFDDVLVFSKLSTD